MWRGAITFGLVNIGVRLYAATEDHDYHFRQIHRRDNGQIRHKRVCSECGEEVGFDDIIKGYETTEGELVVFDSEEFQQLPYVHRGMSVGDQSGRGGDAVIADHDWSASGVGS